MKAYIWFSLVIFSFTALAKLFKILIDITKKHYEDLSTPDIVDMIIVFFMAFWASNLLFFQ